MSFLELLLVLLLLAVGLLQIAGRVGLPYPTMLAATGVLVALLPGAPLVSIEPASALTIFIAPALVAAAYDFPVREARGLRAPLLVFAGAAVLATTAAVALLAAAAGMPVAAALALGAIVAPPDAAAATAILSTLRLPRSTDTLIRGESLFNDAVALLLFELALSAAHGTGLDVIAVGRLLAAAPLGVAFGAAVGFISRAAYKRLSGTLSETLLQFVTGMLVWVAASHLAASAALAVVAYALVIAHRSDDYVSARVRVHSSAVWSTAIFILNVAAFLFMGMQARSIVQGLPSAEIAKSIGFAAAVLLAVVTVRLVVVLGFNRLNALWHRRRGQPEPASLKQAVVVGWTGMRGLVTLAAALALPPDFPMRPLIVLAAFGVVLGTLLLQGSTLALLVGWLAFPIGADRAKEAQARRRLAAAGAARVEALDSPLAAALSSGYVAVLGDPERLTRLKAEARSALEAERLELRAMVTSGYVDGALAGTLRDDLDRREISLLWADERLIAER